MDITAIILILVIMFSAIIHEVMHGAVADLLGDPTARYAGRLTLNPFKHIDPVGSVFLPAILALSHSPVLFGWALPVPYNPYNLRTDGLFRRFSEAFVAVAGPASNFALALFASVLLRFAVFPGATDFLALVVVVNVMLCLFNLIPIPPLDGSKLLSALLPSALAYRYDRLRGALERNPFGGMGLVLLIMLIFGNIFGTAVYAVAQMLAGNGLL